MFKIQKLFLALLLFCGLAGCEKNNEPHDKKVLSIGSLGNIVNIDAQVVSSVNEVKFLSAIFEGLVVPEPETYRPLPGVAERWTVSEDGKIYEFYLRKDARWSNGDFVIADDFVFTVKRALSSRFGCSFIEMFFPIKNAKKFYKRKIRDFSKVGISAIDKHTLRIELKRPCSSFMYFIMQPCWYPLNRMVCESFETFGDWNGGVGDLCVSNGPFIMTGYHPGKNITLEKNPYYWDYDNVKLDGVRWMFGDSESDVLKMFQEDVIDMVPHNIMDSISCDHPVRDLRDFVAEKEIKSALCFGCCYFVFNTLKSPLTNRNVRLALSIAVDRKRLMVLSPNDVACAAYGLIPATSEDLPKKSLFSEDIEKAKSLLNDAGYGDKFPRLKVICNNRNRCRVVAEFLKKEWKRNLGIDIEIEYYPWDKFLSYRKEGNFDVAFNEWFGDYPDPMTFLSLFSDISQQNYCHWNNAEYNRLLDLATGSNNPNTRSKILEQAEGILIRDMPVMPLYFEYNTYLIKERVMGWNVNLMDVYPWKFVDLKIR